MRPAPEDDCRRCASRRREKTKTTRWILSPHPGGNMLPPRIGHLECGASDALVVEPPVEEEEERKEATAARTDPRHRPWLTTSGPPGPRRWQRCDLSRTCSCSDVAIGGTSGKSCTG